MNLAETLSKKLTQDLIEFSDKNYGLYHYKHQRFDKCRNPGFIFRYIIIFSLVLQ